MRLQIILLCAKSFMPLKWTNKFHSQGKVTTGTNKLQFNMFQCQHSFYDWVRRATKTFRTFGILGKLLRHASTARFKASGVFFQWKRNEAMFSIHKSLNSSIKLVFFPIWISFSLSLHLLPRSETYFHSGKDLWKAPAEKIQIFKVVKY